jgi:hypothetical protein
LVLIARISSASSGWRDRNRLACASSGRVAISGNTLVGAITEIGGLGLGNALGGTRLTWNGQNTSIVGAMIAVFTICV